MDVGGGDHAARLHGLEQETAAVPGLLNGLLAEAGLAVFPAKREQCEQRRKFVAFDMADVFPSLFVCILVIVSHFLTFCLLRI